ncbi:MULTISPECIES: HtaA domain-containing protein [unclassified Brevibacterium]|uniref:HtaA domain-containing protein n=1 Tax=unclassified Brevibacterium TaxID=2614124 RepID=UPI001E516A67|nr:MULTISPECIES: HtaA domain-containing protein [unclassified Brevibacterium]MCD1285644.1 hypothetical protein [Brevibacterium sp. CCUG 69071]MDK8434702.1 HtaA domain-containing protein [Brevibacterium sp. H-BE7]
MTHRSARASASRARRITSPLAAGAAVAATTGLLAMGMTAPAFGAVDKTVDDAVFSWSVNDESTGGAYFGGCNFLVAGTAGDAGSSRIWTAADAGKVYPVDGDGNFVDGNTSIKKTTGDLSNFENRCVDGDGEKVNGKVNAQAANNHTGDHVEISNGSGTVDPESDNASIQWEGSWTFSYYGGMTYWSISDPKLEVKDGKGTITGTYSGFGADMDDPSIWKKLGTVEGDVVEIQKGSVDVTDEGFEFTPDFLGVETDTAGRNPQTPKTADNESWWGAMPQDWIDYNVETGQDSYWYTTAGAETSIQPRKKTNPVTVGYTAQAPAPNVSTSHSVKTATAEDGLTVNVKGEGYDNLPDSSTGKPSAGAYAAIVDRDLASADVTADNATAAQYVLPFQIKDGKIDVDVTAKTAGLSEDKDYDVLTWVAHGLPTGDAELYRSAIELTDEQKEALFPSDEDEAEAEANGAADGAEAGDDGAADVAEGDNDGAEGTDEGAADAAEGESDNKGAADAAEGEADGAEADDKGAAEADETGAADASEGEADDKGAADAAEGSDNGAADAAEGEADDKGAADAAEADDKGAADGDDSDGSSDGDEERPAAPEVADQTVGADRLVKGKATPNSEVNLAWTPVVENETDENAGTQLSTFAASAEADDSVPAEDNVTVTADDEGNFSTKAPSAKGTYAYSAIATVEGVPSDPAEFTVTVNEDEAADDDANGSSDGAEGGSDSAGAADGSEDGAEADASGSDNGAEADASGSDNGAGSGAEGSSSGGSGGSTSGGSGGGNLPRTGTDLITLPIAAGLIALGAASVMFTRMRKR